jgi:hypothetical protein
MPHGLATIYRTTPPPAKHPGAQPRCVFCGRSPGRFVWSAHGPTCLDCVEVTIEVCLLIAAGEIKP